MLNKRTIQFLKSLKDKSTRYTEGYFLAEGSKTAVEILASNLQIEAIYATNDWCNLYPKHKNSSKLVVCTQKEIEQISSLKSTRDVVLQVKINNQPIENNKIENSLSYSTSRDELFQQLRYCLGLDDFGMLLWSMPNMA
jgi:TrmH family RNA methyltransferase